MKLILARTFFSFLLLLSVGVFAQTQRQGGQSGGGGDIYALDFVKLSKDIFEDILVLTTVNKKPDFLDVTKFRTTIHDAVVESTERQLFIEGDPNEKDAINYPDSKPQKIVFNRVHWDMMDKEHKKALVLHEYFSLLKLEKDTMDASTQVFQQLEDVKKDVERFTQSLSNFKLRNKYRCHVEDRAISASIVIYVDMQGKHVNYITDKLNGVYDFHPASKVTVNTKGDEEILLYSATKDPSYQTEKIPWVVAVRLAPDKSKFKTSIMAQFVNESGGGITMNWPAVCKAE